VKRVYLLLGVVSALLGVVSLVVFSTGTQVRGPIEEIQTTPSDSSNRPLRFLMVGLGQDMGRINDGIWHEDYEMVRSGAQSIADHPRVTPEEMAAIKIALGEQFQAFVGYDQVVHQIATKLAKASQARNMEDILQLQSQLTQNCSTCHTMFRAEVRKALY